MVLLWWCIGVAITAIVALILIIRSGIRRPQQITSVIAAVRAKTKKHSFHAWIVIISFVVAIAVISLTATYAYHAIGGLRGEHWRIGVIITLIALFVAVLGLTILPLFKQMWRRSYSQSAPAAGATTTQPPRQKGKWRRALRRILLYLVAPIVICFVGFKIWPEGIPAVHQDVVCLDDAGHRKELHYESFAGSEFDVSFQDGCGMRVNLPFRWGRQWHAQPATNDRNLHWHIYARDIGQQKYRGPYDLWTDASLDLQNPSRFYVQAAEKGVKIHFWTDASASSAYIASATASTIGYNLDLYASDPNYAGKIVAQLQNLPDDLVIAERIQSYLTERYQTSPITGKMIADASSSAGVSSRVVMAILLVETNMGTDGSAGSLGNNPGNWGNTEAAMAAKQYVNFRTMEEGIQHVADWLALHRL